MQPAMAKQNAPQCLLQVAMLTDDPGVAVPQVDTAARTSEKKCPTHPGACVRGPRVVVGHRDLVDDPRTLVLALATLGLDLLGPARQSPPWVRVSRSSASATSDHCHEVLVASRRTRPAQQVAARDVAGAQLQARRRGHRRRAAMPWVETKARRLGPDPQESAAPRFSGRGTRPPRWRVPFTSISARKVALARPQQRMTKIERPRRRARSDACACRHARAHVSTSASASSGLARSRPSAAGASRGGCCSSATAATTAYSDLGEEESATEVHDAGVLARDRAQHNDRAVVVAPRPTSLPSDTLSPVFGQAALLRAAACWKQSLSFRR